jgi:hypothetical protein
MSDEQKESPDMVSPPIIGAAVSSERKKNQKLNDTKFEKVRVIDGKERKYITRRLQARDNENHEKAVSRLAGYGWNVTIDNSQLDEKTKSLIRKR